jgi:hypothetical protein
MPARNPRPRHRRTVALLVAACLGIPAGAAATLPSRGAPGRSAPPAEPAPLESIVPCERRLCAGRTPFEWRGVTAFALVDLVAEGRRDDAVAFLDWASATGFTVVRVLTMLPEGDWMALSPEDGRKALPEVCRLARERGLYVQAVALANTGSPTGRYGQEAFLREQVREVARACSQAGNCVLEIANEPYHGTQADLDRPALMRTLQREVPAGLAVTWGAAEDDRSTAMAGGTFVVSHLSRSGPWWERVARARDLAALSARTGKFVVDNEPIGAAEKPERSRRDSAPDAFFAQGVASRLAGAGATFHCEDCLHARVPGPVQQQCAKAFIAGLEALPREVAPQPPRADVARLPEGAQGALASGVAGPRAWVLLLGPADASTLRWERGWRSPSRIVERGDVQVWTATR